MTLKASKQVGARAMTGLWITAAMLIAAGATARADGSSGHPSPVGTWTVQVTLRDCTSSAPLGPAFNSLVTFHADGTVSESAGSLAFAPGQRSPGHGSWTRKRAHTYGQEMMALVLFDTEPNLPASPTFDPTRPVSPGFFAGWQTVSHTVKVIAADQIVSIGTNGFYKANGELYRSGCSTATGRRF